MRKERILGVVFCAFWMLCGCASVKVTRTDVDKKVDLSGNWNDTDSRLVAEEMIKDCFSRQWLDRFSRSQNKLPVVIVGTIKNRTSEHIDSQLFTSDLEKNLINSDKVLFVAAKDSRVELREERQDQAENASKSTAKPSRVETGADFMLQGSINSIKDEIRGKYVILYQVNLELVNLTTNEKAWIGQKKIKKVVAKSALGL